MVINKNIDIDKCINTALNQYFNNDILQDFYNKMRIKSVKIDMNENNQYLIMLIILKKLMLVMQKMETFIKYVKR